MPPAQTLLAEQSQRSWTVTVLKSALNGPSMWFFTLNITLVPVLVIGVLYLLLAAVIPLIVLTSLTRELWWNG